MPPRKRKIGRDDWPENLHDNGKGYYYYLSPITGKKTQLGTDLKAAKSAAKKANALIRGVPRPKKVKVSVSSVTDLHLPRRLEQLDSPYSQKRARNFLARIQAEFGARDISDVSSLEISEFLDGVPKSYRAKMRTEFILLFRYALARGFLPHNYGNPAEVTEYTTPPKSERMRLGYQDYLKIYQHASEPLRLAMSIMLHTTLRPGDVCRLRFDQFYDGALHTQIRKSKKFLKIELNRAEQDIIKKARASGILSPYIVHKKPQRRRVLSVERDHPTQLTVETLSTEFREIRDKVLAMFPDVPAKQRPSLYEVRSLASDLYEAQGRDRKEVAALMAHTSEKMTEHYQDSGRVKFVSVQAGLEINSNSA